MPTTRRAPDRPVILLTGFGPFPTVAANATSILVPRIAAAVRRAVPGAAIEAHILPTEWERSLALIEELARLHKPAVALHFGVSARATGFEIETRGRNICSLSEDAAGRLPIDPCISPGGPEFLPATLPTAHIVMRLRRRGLPAQLSRDAGGYLCNALLYRSLEIARGLPTPARTGFVHLPANLVNERRPTLEPRAFARLTWDEVVDGSLEIVAAALGRQPGATSRTRGNPPVSLRSTIKPAGEESPAAFSPPES